MAAPGGVARDDGYGVVGGDGLMGEVFYACSPCNLPIMAEPDSQLLTDDKSSSESNFFEADPVAACKSRRLCAEARERKRAERALDEHRTWAATMASGAKRPSAPAPLRTRRPTLSQLESRGISARRLATAGVRSLLSKTSTWASTPARRTPSPLAPLAPSRPRLASRALSTSAPSSPRSASRAGSKHAGAFETKADAGVDDAAVRAAAAIDHEREGA